MVKESLRVGQKDVEKGDGSYKVRPVVNDLLAKVPVLSAPASSQKKTQ